MKGQASGVSVHCSPNFNERDPSISLSYIVLHYTGMLWVDDWIVAVSNPAVELSAHYVVGEDGGVVQLVDESKRAWHAGKSFWRGITDMNSASVGIELQNPGHEHGYRAFSDEQIEALKKLIRDIAARHGMNLKTCLLGHSDIAPMRKIDPGELFPWRELAQEGLGVWPDVSAQDGVAFDISEVVQLLGLIGYNCLDDVTARASLSAFLRRFHPERLEKGADGETMVRLRAVAEAFK